MTRTDLRFCVDTCDRATIQAHLLECDDQFKPPLSERVNMRDYSRKIRAKGLTFEAWRGATLVGLAAVYLDGTERSGYITSVSVLPRYNRARIATTLMTQLMTHAFKSGIQEIALEVGRTNAAAIGLYGKFGFRAVEARGNFVLMAARNVGRNHAVKMK